MDTGFSSEPALNISIDHVSSTWMETTLVDRDRMRDQDKVDTGFPSDRAQIHHSLGRQLVWLLTSLKSSLGGLGTVC